MEDVTIACNCCVGARFYEQTNTQFDNPFMWNLMSYSDFIKIIKEWDNLDLTNPKGEIIVGTKEGGKEEGGRCVLLTLKNGVNLKFIHHLYNPNFKVKKVSRPYNKNAYNLIGNNILEYTLDKWETRRQRIGDKKPIFVYFDNDKNGIDLSELITLDTVYKIIVFSSKEYSHYESDRLHFIKREGLDTVYAAKQLVNFSKEHVEWFKYK